MASSIPIPLRPARCFAANVWSGATHDSLWPRNRVQKWGRSRPLQCITRVQTARRAVRNLYVPNNFASPLGDFNGHGDGYVCLSRTRHLSAPGKASKPFLRISIRNGFTRPTGDINVNSPLFTKRPAREEILTENLFDLPSPPVGCRPLSITPTFASAVHFRFAVPHRVRFRICRKCRGRGIRSSREAGTFLDG